MANALRKAFDDYVGVVRSEIAEVAETEATGAPLKLHVEPGAQLRAAVERVEKRNEFNQLVTEAISTFGGDYHSSKKQLGRVWGWDDAVRNFFRRSGFYLDLYEKKTPSADDAFSKFCDAFETRTVRKRYLAPLELVCFEEDSFDFGNFHIRRFSADELHEIFTNRINKVFYPSSFVDVELLPWYWLIDVSAEAPAKKLGILHVGWSESTPVRVRYTTYPKSIENALKRLVLFDWESLSDFMGYDFSVGFVATVDDSLLDSPYSAPDVSSLVLEPRQDSNTGEEIWVPVIANHLDGAETASFKEFAQRMRRLFEALEASGLRWDFLELALGYLLKADFAGGTEGLLCKITVIEALLTDKGTGINCVARRLGSILGNTDKERRSIRKRFKRLYGTRCDLVHGSPLQTEISDTDLRAARNLARRAVLWFLHCVYDTMHEKTVDQALDPGRWRQDILAILDLGLSRASGLSLLADTLPKGFPSVPDWVR